MAQNISNKEFKRQVETDVLAKFRGMTLADLLHHYAVLNMVLKDYDEIPLDKRTDRTDREAIEHRHEQFLCAIAAIMAVKTSGDLARVMSLGIKQDLIQAVNARPISEMVN